MAVLQDSMADFDGPRGYKCRNDPKRAWGLALEWLAALACSNESHPSPQVISVNTVRISIVLECIVIYCNILIYIILWDVVTCCVSILDGQLHSVFRDSDECRHLGKRRCQSDSDSRVSRVRVFGNFGSRLWQRWNSWSWSSWIWFCRHWHWRHWRQCCFVETWATQREMHHKYFTNTKYGRRKAKIRKIEFGFKSTQSKWSMSWCSNFEVPP